MPAITFAIPFYRQRDYLHRAILSVFAQTVDDWELIVSDDAGPEGDLSDWIATLPESHRIRYVRQPRNLGIAGNWNACLRLASAELVTLLHADDELEPRYLDVMRAAADRHAEASVFFCQASVINADGRNVFSFPDWYKQFLLPARNREFLLAGEDGLRAIYRGNFIMCPTMCYRRRDLPEPLFDQRWRQVLDLEFITRLLVAGQTLVGLPDIAYRYRRHDTNQTKVLSDSLTRFEEERDLYQATAALATDLGWPKAARMANGMGIIKKNLAFCILQDLSGFRIRHAWKKTRFLGSLIRGIRRPDPGR